MQMPSGQTVVYQPTQQADAGTQQQQIQTIQLQTPGMTDNSGVTGDLADCRVQIKLSSCGHNVHD